MTESRMVEKCQANDQEGFRALMQAYGPLVYRTCFYYTQSREDTLDLMQEPLGTVKTCLHRGRQALRDALLQQETDEELKKTVKEGSG
ncbi:MAG: hypothetical protein SCK57_05765 [Bacillota bacterium]|nr:hypothetical protein [Bacillota bacterium]